MNRQIIVTEVGPRDGLQNEKKILDSALKAELIDKAVEAGYKIVEFGYFVNPLKTPALADAEEVYSLIKNKNGAILKALVDDIDGLKRADACGLKDIKMAISVSNTHNLKNLKKTKEETLEDFKGMTAFAKDKGINLSCAVSTSFGCPYEGKMKISDIDEIVSKLVGLKVGEIYISDTAGMGNPREVEEFFSYFINKYPDTTFSAHFHNTRDMGLANVYAALKAGVKNFDSSFGGLGGCPYAVGAKGNICSEDLIHMLEQMGYDTGVDLDKTLDISRCLEKIFDKEMNSYILRAGKVPVL
jgi:hydroxymethylglutaryl-CoA lyase